MSAPQFTPGPWEAWKPSTDAECWSICDNEHSRSLAAVWPEALIEGPLPVEANARLIAAAPCMAAYVQRKADEGDAEAIALMERVHGS